MSSIINADTSNGLKLTSDTTGQLDFQSAGSTKATIDTAGNLKFDSGYGSVATGYGCRAWVNFNGTGTVAIRESGNVSSITDNGTGDYTVNFVIDMPDVNYAANAAPLSTNRVMLITTNSYVVGSVKVQINYVNLAGGNTPALNTSCSVAVFR